MKTTKYYLFTSKNEFNKEDNIIYNLMIKGGLIRKLSSGIFIWLPNGLNIINNVCNIIRNNMNKVFGIEIYMPIMQSSNIWKYSKRFYKYGNELFKFYNRNKKLFILSPTNEECITKIICDENFNNNDFPKVFYQIQTKFRDEIRPRYNILRSREFLMKDAYSFHNSIKCLDKFYLNMIDIYINIFNKIGLNILYKEADCGNIGGFLSHEFHVPSIYGENEINISKNKYKYFFNYKNNKKIFYKSIKLIYFKNFCNKYINDFININLFIKTYLIKLYKRKYISKLFILIPYNKKIDIKKIFCLYPLFNNIFIKSKKYIYKKYKLFNFFFSPIGINYPIIADISLKNKINFIVGGNKNNCFYINVNWFKNIFVSGFYDICKNLNIYISKKLNNNILKLKSIELAHIFKLKNFYTNFFYKKNNLLKNNLYMGCYGIGINRIIFSIIEKYKKKNSIIFPLSISHFKLYIIPINMYNFKIIYKFSFNIYYFLKKNNINVLLDDRKLYLGEMITDCDLIGVPNILIISYKMLLIDLVEFRDRVNNIIKFINKKNIFNFLLNKYNNII